MPIKFELISTKKKGWLTKFGFASALLLLTVISYTTFYSVDQFASGSRLIDHTHLVIKKISRVFSDVEDAESSQRAYMLTSDGNFLKSYYDIVADLPVDIASLKALEGDNSARQESITVLENIIEKRMQIMRSEIDAFADRASIGNDQMAMLVSGDDRTVMNQLRGKVDLMIAEQEKLLLDRVQLVESQAMVTKRWILFGNMLAIVLLISAFWLILWEIEHRKTTQREIERSAAQLELTNKELESFSYSVSHDLRSPLRAIDGYSRILEEDFTDRLDEEGHRLLGVIRTSSKKMGQLIDDLLSFSQMGRKPIEAGKVDMNTLVNEVWFDVCNSAKISLPLKKEFLPVGWGDRALLRQVWINLLANAVKYSSKKTEQRIEIFAKQSEDEVVYSVRDNGVGFDMRFYNKLFGVFQRLHTENEFPGTGVGLAIAQRVIVRHGGRIWAESKPNEYTVFSFSLPRKAMA